MDPVHRRLVRLAPRRREAVSMEPLGAGTRRGLVGCAGYDPPRDANATTGRADA